MFRRVIRHCYDKNIQKRIKCVLSTLRRKNLKTRQSPAIWDCFWGKTRSGKSHDFRDACSIWLSIVCIGLEFDEYFSSQEFHLIQD